MQGHFAKAPWKAGKPDNPALAAHLWGLIVFVYHFPATLSRLQKGDVMDKSKLNHKDVWSGEYKGLSFEIVRWRFTPDGEDKWNYYVFFSKRQLGDELFAKLVDGCGEDGEFDYYKSPLVELSWHGGITFGEFVGRKKDYIKAGCDYMHLYDEGRIYDIDRLLFDMKQTVDEFWRLRDLLLAPVESVQLSDSNEQV